MFCVYLTIYKGNKLPPFYIGYSTVEKIKNGYRGSVSSEKYKITWKNELKKNPQLFDVKILSYHQTINTAKEEEYKLQLKLRVHKNLLYCNLNINGKKFYIEYCGSKNPMWGKHHSEETKQKISSVHKSSQKHSGSNNFMFGKTHSNRVKEILSEHGKIKWDNGSRKKMIETKTLGTYHTPWGDFIRVKDAVSHSESILKDSGVLRDWCINSTKVKKGRSSISGKSPSQLGFGFSPKIR